MIDQADRLIRRVDEIKCFRSLLDFLLRRYILFYNIFALIVSSVLLVHRLGKTNILVTFTSLAERTTAAVDNHHG